MRIHVPVPKVLALLLAIGSLVGVASPVRRAESASETATEGIQVRGDWIVEVRNPDGTTAARQEVRNSLLGGDKVLVDVLMGSAAGTWWIFLRENASNSSVGQPCGVGGTPPAPTTTPAFCLITEARSTAPAARNIFKNMVTSQATVGTLELRGTAVVAFDSTLRLLNTHLGVCPGTTAPANCVASVAGTNTQSFSLVNLSPIPVVADQQILVTVRFRFSTAPAP